ncbi:MAG: hypothetical protein OEL82_01450 [Nitrosopumilus sp.]|nr:hypothetical protein [Nitrosopumilus sp.]
MYSHCYTWSPNSSEEFETYVILQELQACERTTFYRILEGYQFITNSDIYPYREFIQNLYQKRMELKERKDPLQLPIKIILNSIYGKTGQSVNHEIGNLFNPVIFAFITGFCRAQLYNFVRKHDIEKDVVAFATDSVCTTKYLGVNSTTLGEFSFEKSADDVYYLQNGFYRFNGSWKQRGLGKLKKKDIEHLDTVERRGRLFIKFIEKKSQSLIQAIIQNKISDVGIIKPKTKEVNLNGDRKRLWMGKIKSIEDKIMNESLPLSLNHFNKASI